MTNMSYKYRPELRLLTRFFVISAVFGLVLVGGISIAKAVTDDSQVLQSSNSIDELLEGSVEGMYAKIAKDIPEFAGMYIDKDTLYINIANKTDTLQVASRSEVEQVFGEDLLTEYNIAYRNVEYGFGQLKEWYGPFLQAISSVEGVTLITIDEQNNRLKVGIEDFGRKADVEEAVAKNGVPLDAIKVVQNNYFVPNATLNDLTRPLLGGLRITYGASACTLGFGGNRSGTLGFVTASHCTTNMGQNDGTVFNQGGDYIGTESSTSDPAFFTGGACPSGKYCRYSDSAFINKSSSDTMSIGKIAKPTASDHTEPIDWNGIDKYRIVGERPPIDGEIVEKVGKTTGRTAGNVLDTGVIGVPSPNYWILDQVTTNYSSADGDSGSPVFRVTNSPNTGDVLLLGIHWGSDSGISMFSPIGKNNIKRTTELGGFVTADTTICPSCRNWDHYYAWRGGSQASNKAVWWSANEFIARYPEVQTVQFNSGGGSSGWADSAYVKFCPNLNANGEPINCIGEKYVSNINDYGTTTVTYSPPLQLNPGQKYWLSVNTGGSTKVLVYYSNYGTTDYTEGCNKWHDGTLYNSCSIDLNGTVEAPSS
jgi:hypothetical protein